MKKLLIATSVLTLPLLIGIAAWWQFRTVTNDHPYFGTQKLEMRWENPFRYSADLDKNGTIDFVAIWPGYESQDPPEEVWSDPSGKGYLEFHVTFLNGEIYKTEVDDDGDGVYDRWLSINEQDQLGQHGAWPQLNR